MLFGYHLGRCNVRTAINHSILDPNQRLGWFPNLTRAYDNNGRCPRQKFVLAYYSSLQLYMLQHITYSILLTIVTAINQRLREQILLYTCRKNVLKGVLAD